MSTARLAARSCATGCGSISWRASRGGRTSNQDAHRNLNEGIFGANYVGDLDATGDAGRVYRSVNVRLTFQATQKNKFNIFWDEQYTCSNPCEGTTGSVLAEASSYRSSTYPVHLAQLSWNNPLTNRILFDAGLSWYATHVDFTKNRFLTGLHNIPRIVESGTTTPRGAGSHGDVLDQQHVLLEQRSTSRPGPRPRTSPAATT